MATQEMTTNAPRLNKRQLQKCFQFIFLSSLTRPQMMRFWHQMNYHGLEPVASHGRRRVSGSWNPEISQPRNQSKMMSNFAGREYIP